MGFMDKVKAQAQTAMQQAQQVAQQGQSKLDEMATKKQSDALLRDLGAAIYAEQRTGGSAEATSSAWRRIDAHVATSGPISTAATAPPAAQPSERTPEHWSTATEGSPVPPTTSAAGAPTATPTPPTGSASTTPPPAAPPSAGRPATGDFSLDDL